MLEAGQPRTHKRLAQGLLPICHLSAFGSQPGSYHESVSSQRSCSWGLWYTVAGGGLSPANMPDMMTWVAPALELAVGSAPLEEAAGSTLPLSTFVFVFRESFNGS